ncbi:MAG: Glycosyl transferase, group 2 family [Nitrospira sp.]|jgi:glycosyltransferase involved in cell wall biosynthesis|nr:MAG: Glycosyl transferase, group 2 family [Nitrospira sp.]
MTASMTTISVIMPTLHEEQIIGQILSCLPTAEVREAPLKTILLMWTLRFLYWIGVSPHRLKDFYTAVR